MRIRPMRAEDAEAAAQLSGQLGYPNSAAEVGVRFRALAERPPNAALVAEDEPGGAILGWVHVQEVLTVESGPWADLGGLVVHEGARGRGVGRLLLEAAERWAIERRYPEMRVRSNVIRAEAHAFYRHLGYEVIKTQLNFRKPLLPVRH